MKKPAGYGLLANDCLHMSDDSMPVRRALPDGAAGEAHVLSKSAGPSPVSQTNQNPHAITKQKAPARMLRLCRLLFGSAA